MVIEAENIALKAEVRAYAGNRLSDPQSLLEKVSELEFENASLKIELKSFHDYKYIDFQSFRQRVAKLEPENASLKARVVACEEACAEFGDPQFLCEKLDDWKPHMLNLCIITSLV
ncbi:hypothetical protein A2U01_0049346 [Trifolium medium]|uniref:Uncharacterized protein n=1 Tax=Trifolium medium TaxID=97028 RepID=A0A392QX88_9FABA|nr:hypothetical protein [Trifolium medium]